MIKYRFGKIWNGILWKKDMEFKDFKDENYVKYDFLFYKPIWLRICIV